MRKIHWYDFDFLQLFAEGGGGEGGTGGGPTGAEGAALAQPQTTGVKNPLASVQYGKPEEPADAGQAPQNAEPDKSAKFEALIRGEFKDEYEHRLKDTIEKRLKGTQNTVDRFNQLSPVLDLLAGKYGVDVNDIGALSKAIEEDESFYEDEALERGLSVAQVKEMRRINRENAELRAQMQAQENRQQADALYASWMQQAEAVKQVYPSFDLGSELQNEQFRSLLKSNVPLQTAYEVLHKDEILPAAMQFAAQKVEAKVANNIRAGKARPTEGAARNQSAIVTKSDVSQLTRADRDEIDRRVARGEKIRF